MKRLEIIRNIIEEDKNQDIMELLNNNYPYNLSLLCLLNKKYLTDENLDIITIKILDTAIKYNFHDNKPTYVPSYNIGKLIGKYPELLNKLPKIIIDTLNHHDWGNIIADKPNFFNICKIVDKFDVYDWINILTKQPQLVVNYKNVYKDFKFESKPSLVSVIDSIAKYIDVNRINVTEEKFKDILKKYPEIVKKLNENKLKEISIESWVDIMSYDPKLIEFCPTKDHFISYINSIENIKSLINILSKQPQLINMLPSIDKISNGDLSILIKNQPQLIEKLNIDLNIFSGYEWSEILRKQPHLIDRCDKIDKINIYNITYLLFDQPILIDYFSKDLSPNYIVDLIEEYPYLIKKLKTNDIDKFDFEKILYSSKEYHIEAMNKYTKKFHDIELLTNMIGIYPDLKELYTKRNLWTYVDFTQLSDNLEYSILK